MAALDPFEAEPALAVAISGGADSMALCLLANAWARGRGGRVLALIVDHGLRMGSADEARLTASRLSARGIASEILAWTGDKPASAIHAEARRARYRLLADRCRERGLLHLLVAHQLEDQAETMLLRRAAGSGPSGLAGMSSIVETSAVRVLRPLLQVPKRRLCAYLASCGQAWIEDPSNADPAFARTRVRAALRDGAPGTVLETLAEIATCRGLRQRRDEAVAALLARSCRLHPIGFVLLDAAMARAEDGDIVEAALGRVAATVGGTAFPPTTNGLSRLRRHLSAQAPATVSLGRCIWRTGSGGKAAGGGTPRIVVFRESRGLPVPLPLVPGMEVEWDGRFLVHAASSAGAWPGLRLEALGEAGWREALRLNPGLPGAVPRRPALSLPALWDERGLLAVPVLGLYREAAAEGVAAVGFRPRRNLSGVGYCLA